MNVKPMIRPASVFDAEIADLEALADEQRRLREQLTEAKNQAAIAAAGLAARVIEQYPTDVEYMLSKLLSTGAGRNMLRRLIP